MPSLLDHPSEYARNSVEAKQCTSARRMVLRRAGYEGESLSDAAFGRKLAKRGMKHARDAQTFAIYSRELDRWIERERVLLRIPLPRQAESIDVKQSAPTVYEVDRAPAPASPSTPAQPTSSTPTQ